MDDEYKKSFAGCLGTAIAICLFFVVLGVVLYFVKK